MLKTTKRAYYAAGAAISTGLMLSAGDAMAAGGNNFGSIAKNITVSTGNIPGMITGLSYLFGILLGVLGIMKIKDHVENPTNTPLKDGAIRLASGGALFALPIIYEAMFETVGSKGVSVGAAKLQAVKFNVAAP